MKKLEFHYFDWNEFRQFLDKLPDKDAAKLIATIQNIENNGILIAERQLWIKKLENNLYEIRSKRSSNIQRAIYFQVQGNQYVISNAFTKKTQKTPENEKKLARNRRSLYLKKGGIIMSKLDEYVTERSRNNPNFAQIVEQENINLEVALKVRDLRENLNMSQRNFAKLVGKPQSTIARIENGSMNASTKILSEIAQATNQRLTIQFSPAL